MSSQGNFGKVELAKYLSLRFRGGGELGTERSKHRGIKPLITHLSLPTPSPFFFFARGHRMETSSPCSQRKSAGCGNFAGKAFLEKSGKTVMWF